MSALLEAAETHRESGIDVLVCAVSWPQYVEGVSTSRTRSRMSPMRRRSRSSWRWTAGYSRSYAAARPISTPPPPAASLGGAGHPQAASAIFRGSLEEATTRFLDGLGAAIRKPVRARDVMAHPARSVTPDETVAAAMVACQRYGQSGILVTEGGRLVGSVRREDLDKAIGHGLSHAPVKGIMSGRVRVVDEEASLGELQRLLASSAEGRLAVLHGERLVGVVTRSDLLQALGEAVEIPSEPTDSIADELGRLERLAPVFDAVAAASDTVDGVYLVGGTVRDILLGEPSFDVDIAVEGDAIGLARSMASSSAAASAPTRSSARPSWSTATSSTSTSSPRARSSTTPRRRSPRSSTRRSGTTSTAATSRSTPWQPRSRARTSGGSSSVRRAPRPRRRADPCPPQPVLHRRPDPDLPRRALRESARLPHGRAHGPARAWVHRDGARPRPLLDAAARRARGTALRGRGRALRAAARRARRRGAIHPRLSADEEAVRLTKRARGPRGGIRARRPGVAARDRGAGTADVARRVYGWLESLKMRRRDVEQIAHAVTLGPRLVERLRGVEATAADVVALAEPYAPDTPLFALALQELPALRRYFTDLRGVRLEVPAPISRSSA